MFTTSYEDGKLINILIQTNHDDCLTIRELKDIVNNMYDTDDLGNDYLVWIGTSNGPMPISYPVKSVWGLSRRGGLILSSQLNEGRVYE